MSKFLIASFFAVLFSSGVSYAQLMANPSVVDFGQVKIGQEQYQTTTIMNQQNRVINVSATSSCFGSIQVNTGGCFTIYPFSTCTMFIYFQPTAVGYQSCEINVMGSASGGMATVSVNGEGIK